jgi:hypothetical protein
MGGACSTDGGDEKFIQNLLKNQNDRDHSEEIGVDGR